MRNDTNLVMQLLDNKYLWNIIHRFNRSYNMNLSYEEMRSELGLITAKSLRGIQKKNPNFTTQDLVNYAKLCTKYRMCDVRKDQLKWNNILYFEKLFGLDIKCEEYERYNDVEIIKGSFKLYRFIKNKHNSENKLRDIYEKYGNKGLKIVALCILNRIYKVKERGYGRYIMHKLTKNEVEWIEYLAKCEVGDSHFKDRVREIKVSKFLKQNIENWFINGFPNYEYIPDDCFSFGFDDVVKECKECLYAKDCEAATQRRVKCKIDELKEKAIVTKKLEEKLIKKDEMDILKEKGIEPKKLGKKRISKKEKIEKELLNVFGKKVGIKKRTLGYGVSTKPSLHILVSKSGKLYVDARTTAKKLSDKNKKKFMSFLKKNNIIYHTRKSDNHICFKMDKKNFSKFVNRFAP